MPTNQRLIRQKQEQLSYSKLPGKLLVNQVQVWKSGLDDLDKATPKTLEESSSVPSLPNTTTK